MRQFVYISTAARGIRHAEMDGILESAARNNPDNGITGFLIFNGRNFLQLIEGEQAALLSLMNKLARDPRHHGIVRLEDNSIGQRACANWSMQRLNLSDSQDRREAELTKILPDELMPQVRRTVLNFAALN